MKRYSWVAYAGILIGVTALLLGVIFAIQIIPFATATSSNTLNANVAVGSACFTLATPSVIVFGNTLPTSSNQLYYTNVLVTDNDIGGNIGSWLFVEGSTWSSASNTLLAGETVWNPTPQGSYMGNQLTASFANTAMYIAAPSLATPTTGGNVFFGMNVPAGTPAGNYVQTITFNDFCGTASQSPYTNSISAYAQVIPVCYANVIPLGIQFGSMIPGTSYDTNVLVTDYDIGGTAPAQVNIAGSTVGNTGNWVSGGNNFMVTNTLYSPTNLGATIGGNQLTFVYNVVDPINAPYGTSNTIYFGVNVPAGTPAGSYNQVINIQTSC